MAEKQKAVIVRDFDGVTGHIGAVRANILSDLVKRHDADHVLIVTVTEAPTKGQVVVTPVGMENSHFQVNQADVVEMEEEGVVV